MEEIIFNVNLDSNYCNGVRGCGTIQFECTGNKLVELFGEAGEGDGYKVTHEWIFESPSYPGKVFTIYDYKATSDYNDSFPSPEEFMQEEYLWHVGSNADDDAVERFKDYIGLSLF